MNNSNDLNYVDKRNVSPNRAVFLSINDSVYDINRKVNFVRGELVDKATDIKFGLDCTECTFLIDVNNETWFIKNHSAFWAVNIDNAVHILTEDEFNSTWVIRKS